MNDLKRSEYDALRSTIRDRGSLRVALFLGGLVAWGALAIAGMRSPRSLPSLVALMILAAAFEAVYAIHVGVERIGRFVQVFYEEPPAADSPAWETTAMAYGLAHPGTAADPLFVTPFLVAALLNLAAISASGPRRPLVLLLAVAAHGLFAWRTFAARRSARGQRVLDLDRFRKLRDEKPGVI